MNIKTYTVAELAVLYQMTVVAISIFRFKEKNKKKVKRDNQNLKINVSNNRINGMNNRDKTSMDESFLDRYWLFGTFIIVVSHSNITILVYTTVKRYWPTVTSTETDSHHQRPCFMYGNDVS